MKRNKVNIFNWQSILENSTENIYTIGNDFILLENPIIPASFDHPFKTDVTAVLILTGGVTKGKINLVSYTTIAPCMVIMPSNQIMEYEYISEDFCGHILVMSNGFSDSLNIGERLSVFRSVNENPVFPLTETELKSILNYLEMMRSATQVTDNPYRLEVAQNLTRAFFYGGGFYFHKLGKEKEKNKTEKVIEDFMHLLDTHFKQHRDIEFYADKMKLTPKYMSVMVRKHSGKSAGEWINERVIMEAKALLKSTNMTIQQIADELNFSEQSSFGKYFKRQTAMSPKQYRK